MDAETRMEQQRILAARDSEFVFGEGGVADQIQAELEMRAEGWERSYRTADAEREALARLHEVATQRTVELAAVIEKAKNSAYLSEGALTEILSTVDTDAVLREYIPRSRFESLEYYEYKPHKAADDLIRVLREADRG